MHEPGTIATIETTSADYIRAMWTTANVWVGIDGDDYHPTKVIGTTEIITPDVLNATSRMIDRIKEGL